MKCMGVSYTPVKVDLFHGEEEVEMAFHGDCFYCDFCLEVMKPQKDLYKLFYDYKYNVICLQCYHTVFESKYLDKIV